MLTDFRSQLVVYDFLRSRICIPGVSAPPNTGSKSSLVILS